MAAARSRLARAAVLALSCASGGPPSGEAAGAAPTSALASVELESEHALQTLDELIAVRSREPSFPAAALAEARELRRSAGDVFLSGAYDLALALAREAIALLETP